MLSRLIARILKQNFFRAVNLGVIKIEDTKSVVRHQLDTIWHNLSAEEKQSFFADLFSHVHKSIDAQSRLFSAIQETAKSFDGPKGRPKRNQGVSGKLDYLARELPSNYLPLFEAAVTKELDQLMHERLAEYMKIVGYNDPEQVAALYLSALPVSFPLPKDEVKVAIEEWAGSIKDRNE